MTDPVAALREGLRDRYAFERELGRGGMATVWLARDLRHDRPVALKVLHPELAATLGPERFQREIRLAARLQHPHILTVHDSGDLPRAGSTPLLWFTMPFVEGESLRDRLRRERQLPVDDALRIAREAADALNYAHRHEVIHRDIKPENILLTAEGHSLVADFGIARALGGDDPQLTETGLAIGTPAYMSPEQAVGDRGLDARTDVYSLGAVLYEMLAGEPPYTGATTQAILAKRFTEPAPSVQRVRPSVPESVDQAIRKALAPVAADRFSTAAQFAQALQVVPPVPTRDTSTVATPAPSSRPRPGRPAVPVAAVALVLGILIGLGVLFAWRRSGSAPPGGTGPKVLAVLPFENLGDSADAYFADGVADEVRTKLAQVTGLEVIARGSSVEYRGTAKRPAEIARELGADYLLTGTVRWEKAAGAASRVRVTPELVDARPGQAARTRWGQQFDASLTNVFQVQADIATKVADALDLALADSVRAELVARPTASLEAYDAFLKGEAARAGSTTDIPNLQRAWPHYQRAVALDSTFVPAWAELSRVASALYANRAPTPELAELARHAAERARRLGPTRPEGFLALGLYHRSVARDSRQALAAYQAGLKLAPSNVELIVAVGAIEQTLGNWEGALAQFERGAALDPRSPNAARRHALALFNLRRYVEAEAAQARAIALAPGDLTIIHQGAMLALAQGDLARAQRIAREVPPGVDPAELAVQFARFEELAWLLSDAQQRQLLTLPPSAFEGDRANFSLVRTQVHALRGETALARAYADSARLAYEETIRTAGDEGQQYGLLGLALAFMGRMDEAIRAAERGVELLPISRDAYFGPYIQLLLARVHMMAGNHDKAVELLAPLVEVPNNLSKAWLRVDPTFDPLRSHPGFQALVAGTT
jgi:eukaryotic-like serine/threonine-protein kinase